MAKITALGFVMPVRDIDKAVRFYCDAFDLTEVFRTDQIAFVGIEGTDSAVGLLLDPVAAGSGPMHVGFHTDHALDLGDVIKAVEGAGGKLLQRSEHAPGVPFARIADPDGNELEI
jgi:catechol 2,3-dioxygenase-like lactoylglutathione lyase family enzyme